jgi:GTP-binding protein
VASRLRKLGKPVVAVTNKVDTTAIEQRGLAELCSLGFGEPLPLSAREGYGRSAVIDAIAHHMGVEATGDETTTSRPEQRPLRIAIVGRQNVGKSTFVNSILGEERVIVSEVPGTTRDSVDVAAEIDGDSVLLIDTAGLRKRSRVKGHIEALSHGRTREAVRRSDVTVLMLDATRKIGNQDRKIASYIMELDRAVVIVANKWDLADGSMTMEQYSKYVDKTLMGLAFAPLVCMSARAGENILGPIKVARDLHVQAGTRVPTAELNRIVHDVLTVRRPRKQRNMGAKVYYATQAEIHPVTVVLFVNRPGLFGDDWRRFLANKLRDIFPFKEVPIRLRFRERKSYFENRDKVTANATRDEPTPPSLPPEWQEQEAEEEAEASAAESDSSPLEES